MKNEQELFIILQNYNHEGYSSPYKDKLYANQLEAEKQCAKLNKYHKQNGSWDIYPLTYTPLSGLDKPGEVMTQTQSKFTADSKEYLKRRGLKNPTIDSGISGGGDAPPVRVSDVMLEYAKLYSRHKLIVLIEENAELCKRSEQADNLSEQVKELREALEKIIEMKPFNNNISPNIHYERGYDSALFDCKIIVNQVLKSITDDRINS